MATDQYKLGYDEFLKNGTQSTESIKTQHPMWRAGYRAAVVDNEKKNNNSIPLVLYNVPEPTKTYKVTLGDIMGATMRPRYSKLHLSHMSPVLDVLIASVEKHADEITCYNDVTRCVYEKFDIILQYGYDEGILNRKDLKQYNYEPK